MNKRKTARLSRTLYLSAIPDEILKYLKESRINNETWQDTIMRVLYNRASANRWNPDIYQNPNYDTKQN